MSTTSTGERLRALADRASAWPADLESATPRELAGVLRMLLDDEITAGASDPVAVVMTTLELTRTKRWRSP